MSANGKGDKARPLSIKREQFEENWDAIFKKPKPKKPNELTDRKQN
jgi:hypothetical protein